MLRVSENGPFQSEKQSTKVKLHARCSSFAWLLHLLQFEPKECELRQPFQPLQAWKVDWEVFVKSGKPVLSISQPVSQITQSCVGLLKKAFVFDENSFKIVVPMHKHCFSRERERALQFLVVTLLSFCQAFFSSQKSFKIISFLAS